MNPLLIVVLVIVLIGGYLLYVYNAFATAKVRIKASTQEIGNQLKRQMDLIPNLEASAKAYLKHEKGIFTQLAQVRRAVAEAQKSKSLKDADNASQKIAALIPSIRVAVESNPQIKGTEVVTDLMEELRDTADKVMYSRRTLIDLSADYNTMLVTFPSNLVANMFGFTQVKGLETPEDSDAFRVSEDEMKSPTIKL